MDITVTINLCKDCRHRALAEGEFLHYYCMHPKAMDHANKGKEFKHSNEQYHWRERKVRAQVIPKWCPLKHGEAY